MSGKKKATPTRGVPVQLDKERRLRYPLAALSELEDLTVPALIHAGLVHEDPDLTVEEVSMMVDLEMLPDLYEPVKKATGGLVDLGKAFETAETIVEGNVETVQAQVKAAKKGKSGS